MQTNPGLMIPDTIKNILSVGAGSFIGGIARYIISPDNLEQ